MKRKYDKNLVDIIQQNQYIHKFGDLDVLIKPVPDAKNLGEMDPRAYKNFKKMVLMTKILPKSMMQMKFDEKGLARLRAIFNKVDSSEMVTDDLVIDTVYVTVPDGDKISLKVYRKDANAQNQPILYYIHGGGFFAGSTDVVEESMKLMAVTFDITVFSVNYRLAPEYPYPIGHQDTYEGFKWVVENASKYSGDASNIFIAGDSAGGNLTQYCTTRSLEDGLDNVKGQMLLYSALNLTDKKDKYSNVDFGHFQPYSKHKGAIDMAMGLLGGSMDGLRDLIKITDADNVYLSPYLYINKKTPPTMVNVGEYDPLRTDTIAYGQKLKAEGIDVTAVIYRGMPHAYIDQAGNFPQAEDLINDMGRFILKHAKK